ncbi:monocarboxylate transporter 5-like isoform X2 [Homarus americanus]|uniref:monocarboxylate transporter 5-like isoform X2 n=1 Tax=Homarus americanus TaxID=6706 RepID=UPI001C468E0F|nr:monocarboxylate transporter 5-like isoform X2 [Homarus americanus]
MGGTARSFCCHDAGVNGGTVLQPGVLEASVSPGLLLYHSRVDLQYLQPGLGAGLVVTTSVLIVPLYFTHRLGRANGVFMAGTSVGQFIAPHLITFLQDRYAFTGATLILGAIVLNTSVAAATFHPVSWHTGHLDCETGKPFPEKVFLRQSASSRQLNSNLASSNQVTSNRKSRKMNGLLLRVAQSTLRDLGILRSPRALIIAVSSTLVVNGYLNFIMMVPFMVQEAGHSPQSSAWCVSVSGVFNLLTRLAMSAFSECPCFNMHICYVVGIFTIAASSLAFSFLTNATWLMVVMGVWGCGVGAFMGLYNLVMIRYMGIHNLPPMFGAASLLNGLGFITLGPLLGWVRDLSESYAFSIWLLASTQFLCVLLWFFMPAAVARDERRALQDNNSAD